MPISYKDGENYEDAQSIYFKDTKTGLPYKVIKQAFYKDKGEFKEVFRLGFDYGVIIREGINTADYNKAHSYLDIYVKPKFDFDLGIKPHIGDNSVINGVVRFQDTSLIERKFTLQKSFTRNKNFEFIWNEAGSSVHDNVGIVSISLEYEGITTILNINHSSSNFPTYQDAEGHDVSKIPYAKDSEGVIWDGNKTFRLEYTPPSV